jgi:hypothetical protein
MQNDKKALALEAFRKGCTWEEAASACGVHRMTLWRWARSDECFRVGIEEAKADPDHEVEAVTFANACNPDPAHNTLRMFWLKARMPGTYKERLDVTSKGGQLPTVVYVEAANNPRDRLTSDLESAIEAYGYVRKADNPRDAELDGWAIQRARAISDEKEREKVLAERELEHNETGDNP